MLHLRKRTFCFAVSVVFRTLYNHFSVVLRRDYANFTDLGIPRRGEVDFSYSSNDSFFLRFFRSSTFVSIPFLFLSTLYPYLFSVLPFKTSRWTLEISGVSRTRKSRFRTSNSAELNSPLEVEFVLIATAVRCE